MLTHLRTYFNSPEAHIDLNQLRQSGIRCALRNEVMHGLFPVQALPLQIWVHEDDLPTALEVIASESNQRDMDEDFREIDLPAIHFLHRQHLRKGNKLLTWAFLLIMIILLLVAGW